MLERTQGVVEAERLRGVPYTWPNRLVTVAVHPWRAPWPAGCGSRPIQNGFQETLAAYPSLRVQQVVSDACGGLWVATGSAAVVAGQTQGVPPTPPSLLRYRNGHWQRLAVYTANDGFVPAFCRDTTVWGLDPAGVATYHGATRVSLPHHLNAPLVRLMRDQEGHLWGLTLPGDIVYSRDAQQWTMIQTHVGRSRLLLIDPHRYHGVWIATTHLPHLR